jgi:hypothetical protein
MKTKLKVTLILCLLSYYSCIPEDDIIQNAINIYPEFNIDYYNSKDSLQASLIFHTINPFGQGIRLIDETDIFFNDSIMNFDPFEEAYIFRQKGIPDSSIISWYHDEEYFRVSMDMNTFNPRLNRENLFMDQTDSLVWDDNPLTSMEYISFYASDQSNIQYHFHDEIFTNAMLIDSSQFLKFDKDSVIYLTPIRVKQFSFSLNKYRGNEGATRIYADTLFTSY